MKFTCDPVALKAWALKPENEKLAERYTSIRTALNKSFANKDFGDIKKAETQAAVGLQKLKLYLSAAGISNNDFAEKAGINLRTFERYIQGHRMPNLEAAIRIERASGGKIKPEDWGLKR